MSFDPVIAALARDGIDFIVTGGRAVAFHGYDRPIADLDIVVNPAPASAAAVTRSLMMQGFYPTIPLSLAAIPLLRFMDQAGRNVDVNARYPLAFDALAARSVTAEVLGETIRVISLDDLLTIKRARARDYDHEDVARLEELASQ